MAADIISDVEVQMLTWWVDTWHSVLAFSGVFWGHFWVTGVTTHMVTRGSDDVTHCN